jgi:hypothetical protein
VPMDPRILSEAISPKYRKKNHKLKRLHTKMSRYIIFRKLKTERGGEKGV